MLFLGVLLSVGSGGAAGVGFEEPAEGVNVREVEPLGQLGDRKGGGGQGGFGVIQALGAVVGQDALLVHGLEPAHQGEFVEIELLGQGIQGDDGEKVVVDVVFGGDDGVGGFAVQGRGVVELGEDAVEQLQKPGFVQEEAELLYPGIWKNFPLQE